MFWGPEGLVEHTLYQRGWMHSAHHLREDFLPKKNFAYVQGTIGDVKSGMDGGWMEYWENLEIVRKWPNARVFPRKFPLQLAQQFLTKILLRTCKHYHHHAYYEHRLHRRRHPRQ